MNYQERKGNLFDLDEKYVLAHCISLDCQMQKGIALEFDKRFKGMKSWLISMVRDNGYNYPKTIPAYKNKKLRVFNLITKDKYWGKPTYATITVCISEMADFCKRHDVKYLGMPKIGCGLDRLDWDRVSSIIKEEFKDIDIDIQVLYL